jgi:hypothetical protein
MTMKQEFKEKWIKALESGKYPQAKNTLRSKEGYCCLGVLCEVAGAIWDYKRGEYARPKINDQNLGIYSTLTFFGEEYFGLTSDEAGKLMIMNDSDFPTERKTFPEIASWVRENL